jgi:hypothetical protein
VVKEVRSQYRVSKVTSKDAILDVFAEDGSRKLYVVEIQRKETVDHPRRVRFYTAMTDSEYLLKGKDYSELPDLSILYISETDIWQMGQTVYEVKKTIGDANIPYDDGERIIYVNAAVDDGSSIAKLMKYFKNTDPKDMSHGELSKRIHFLKEEEKGAAKMCDIAEEIYEGGLEQGILLSIQNLMKTMSMSAEQAMEALRIPKSEMQKYINQLS